MRAGNLTRARGNGVLFVRLDFGHTYAVYPNLTRDWNPDRINQLRVADITYIRLRDLLLPVVLLQAYQTNSTPNEGPGGDRPYQPPSKRFYICKAKTPEPASSAFADLRSWDLKVTRTDGEGNQDRGSDPKQLRASRTASFEMLIDGCVTILGQEKRDVAKVMECRSSRLGL